MPSGMRQKSAMQCGGVGRVVRSRSFVDILLLFGEFVEWGSGKYLLEV